MAKDTKKGASGAAKAVKKFAAADKKDDAKLMAKVLKGAAGPKGKK